MRSFIHQGDAIEFLRSLPEGAASLAVVDPPYNISVDKRFGVAIEYTSLASWLEWCDKWIAESVRVLDGGGNLFIYSIHHFAAHIHVRLADLGLHYRRQIIWYYENGWSKYTRAPACHYEPILWFSKSLNSTYHPIREPYKSVDRLRHPITKNGKLWTPHPDGRLAGDVWRFPTLAGRRFKDERTSHPTQKPLALTRRIVEHFSNVGETVLVPFVGSGTECVAAQELGRFFVGAELNPEYIQIAEARLARCRNGKQCSEQIDSGLLSTKAGL